MTYEVYNIKTGEYITSTEYNNNYLDDFLTLQVVYVKYCYLKDDAIFKMYDYTHKYLTDTTIQFFCYPAELLPDFLHNGQYYRVPLFCHP